MAVVDLALIITAVNRASGSLKTVGKDVDNLDKKSKSAARGLRAIDVVLTSIAAGSLVAFSKQIVNTAANLEKARVRLAFFERGMAEGDATFAKLRAQFRGVPVETQTLLDGFSRLRAAGLDPLDGSLKAIVDAVSAFGGGTAEMDRAIIAIQQIAGKGVLSMEELRQQLGEAVPFAAKIMADKLGLTMPEFVDRVSKGMISARSSINAFIEGAKESFGGFSAIMAQTIVGGQANVRQAWEGLIKKVFGDSGLDTRIGMFLNGIAQAIEDFAARITQADVDTFVEHLKNMIRFGLGAVEAVIRVTKVVIMFVNTVTASLGSLGADILTSGIIGYALFGKTGFIIGAAIPLIARVQNVVIGMFKSLSAGAKTALSIFGVAAGLGLIGGILIGPHGGLVVAAVTAIFDAVMTAIRDLVRFVGRIPGLGFLQDFADKFGKSGSSVLSNLGSNLAAAMGNGLGDVGGALDALQTPMEATLENLFSMTDGWQAVRAEQDKMIKSTKALNIEITDGVNSTKGQAEALKAAKRAMQNQIDAAKALLDLRRISFDSTDVRLEQSQMPFSSDAADRERQVQRQYMTEVLQVKVRILEAQKDMIDATDEQKKIFQTQIVALQEYQRVVEAAAANTNAQAILMRETWTSVGDAISDSAKRGLSAFAQGTLSVQGLISDLYSTLTDLAANYLVELVKIQALKAATSGGFGGAGGTGFFGGLMNAAGSFFGGFASGGAFPGGTSMGPGLVRGPTAFGLAGEAGPEAILPLRRVGGELGVAAAGGGQTNIYIQALDTQSAVQVLMENSRAMNTALVGNRNLEKSSV